MSLVNTQHVVDTKNRHHHYSRADVALFLSSLSSFITDTTCTTPNWCSCCYCCWNVISDIVTTHREGQLGSYSDFNQNILIIIKLHKFIQYQYLVPIVILTHDHTFIVIRSFNSSILSMNIQATITWTMLLMQQLHLTNRQPPTITLLNLETRT